VALRPAEEHSGAAVVPCTAAEDSGAAVASRTAAEDSGAAAADVPWPGEPPGQGSANRLPPVAGRTSATTVPGTSAVAAGPKAGERRFGCPAGDGASALESIGVTRPFVRPRRNRPAHSVPDRRVTGRDLR
jgi:hypothetical protein